MSHRHPPRRARSDRPVTDGRLVLCVALGVTLALTGCKSKGGSGFNDCVASADCGGGEACFQLESGAGVCLSVCDPDQALCDGGEACVPPTLAGTQWACLPGGDVGVNAACSRSIDCELGAICVTDGMASACRAACDPTAPTCALGNVCLAESPTRGHCGPAVGDMGVADPDQGAADGG